MAVPALIIGQVKFIASLATIILMILFAFLGFSVPLKTVIWILAKFSPLFLLSFVYYIKILLKLYLSLPQ